MIKKKFNKLQENYIERKSHEALLGDDDDDSRGIHKQKLIENEELAWQQGEKLEGAKRQVIEMEQVGNGIMRDLNDHTGKLRIINDRVIDMNSELDQSGSIMGRILKKENRNKVVIGIFSVIVVLAFIIILYLKLAPSSSAAPSPAAPQPIIPNNNNNSDNITGTGGNIRL